MITARELVFYIRAEDQASRVVKRVAGSFGSLSNISSLQKKAGAQQLANMRAIEKSQINIRKNAEAIGRAEVQASRLSRQVASGRPLRGYSMQETSALHQVALSNLATLRRQEELLGTDLDEVRRKGTAASAAIDAQISTAKLGRIQNYISSVQSLARAFRLVGIVAAASLAFAAHSAAQFQTQVTLAASQARPAGAPASTTLKIAGNLQGQILKQMQQFPATAQEMANSFYQIFSGTNIQNVKQAANYVTLFNKAAVGGGATLDEMTQAGISIRNVFGIGLQGEFKNMTQALNVFFSAVRYGRMTASQFSQALGYISPIAKDVSLSFKNIAEDMAFFTRQTGGRMTRQDAQGLARLIQLLARDDVTAGLAQKGIAVFDKVTHKMRPVVDIIKQIHDQLHLTPQETVNFFKAISAAGSGKAGTQGTIQAIRIFSQGIQNVKAYQDVVQHVRADNDEFIKSYNALSKAPGVKWQVFTNQLKAAVIVIGSQAIPAIVRLGEPIVKLLKWFNSLNENTKHTIATVGVFASIAAVLGGTLVIILGSVAKLALTIKELQIARLASEAGFASAGFALWLPILLAVSVILIKYPHTITDVINALGGLKSTLSILMGLMAVFTVARLTGGFSGILSNAVAADKGVGGLRLSLLRLSLIGAITIPIILSYSSQFNKDPRNKGGLGGFVNKYIGPIPVIGSVFKSGAEAGRKAADALGLSDQARAQAKQRAQTKAINTMFQGSQRIKELQTIQTSGANAFLKGEAQSAYVSKDWTTLNKVYGQVMLPAVEKAKATAEKAAIAAKAITQASKDAAWQKLFQNVIKLDKVVSDGKVHSLAEYKALDDAETKLQKASTGNQYQAAQQMLSGLESTWNTAEKSATKHAKNLAKIQAKNVANAKTEIGNLLQGTQSLYDSFLQQNQTNFGTLFAGPVVSGARVQDNLMFGGNVTGTDLLKDIKGQVFQFNRFNRQINELGKRGAPKALRDQIRALGPSAAADIKALNKLSAPEFRQYVAAWNAGQKAIKSNTMTQLNSQLKIYEGFGKKVARAIIKGISSQDQALQSELEKVVLKMFPGLAKQAHETFKLKKIPSTPKSPTLPKYATAPRGGRRLASATEEHTHYHLVPPASDIKTQIKHADFIRRNKYRGNN